MDSTRWHKVQKLLDRFYVQIVLMNGVLKLELVIERDLCPSGVFGVSKNPPCVALGLNHKYAKA